jgi:capsular polysaccharide biosynthesis protein
VSLYGRRAVLFVFCTTILALIAAAAYLGVRERHYEASADVLVAPLATDDPEFQGLPLIRESSDGSRPVQTAAGLLRGTAIANKTASNLGSEWSAAKVESTVRVQPRGESNLVAISAETEDAEEAARIANRYASTALDFRRQAIAPALRREIRAVEEEPENGTSVQRLRDALANGDPTLSVASQARPPSTSSTISTRLVLLAALVVGLLIGVAGVMLADVVRAPPLAPPRPE